MSPKKLLAFFSICVFSGFCYLWFSQHADTPPQKPIIDSNADNKTTTSSPSPHNQQPTKNKTKEDQKAVIKVKHQIPNDSQPVDPQTEPSKALQQLRFIRSCYQSNDVDCNYSNNDPRQTSYLIGQDIKEELAALLQRWKNNEICSAELSQAAIESLSNPDGHVQEAALKILAELPISNDHHNAIVMLVSDSYNTKIIKQAMTEIQRYQDSGTIDQIDQVFIEQLKTGAPYASQEIAKNILPFINQNNIGYYQETLDQLPPQSKKAQLLKSNIEEYHLLNQGG